MTNLYLLFGQEYRIIHTVYLRIDTQTGIVIIYAMETVNRIGSHFFAAANLSSPYACTNAPYS